MIEHSLELVVQPYLISLVSWTYPFFYLSVVLWCIFSVQSFAIICHFMLAFSNSLYVSNKSFIHFVGDFVYVDYFRCVCLELFKLIFYLVITPNNLSLLKCIIYIMLYNYIHYILIWLVPYSSWWSWGLQRLFHLTPVFGMSSPFVPMSSQLSALLF
jgi:hypothetical protein